MPFHNDAPLSHAPGNRQELSGIRIIPYDPAADSHLLFCQCGLARRRVHGINIHDIRRRVLMRTQQEVAGVTEVQRNSIADRIEIRLLCSFGTRKTIADQSVQDRRTFDGHNRAPKARELK